MQIHELNSFVGTPSATDYLPIDDGTETTKVPASNLGVTVAMTVAEAEAGTSNEKRVMTPKMFHDYVEDNIPACCPVGSYYETSDANFDPSTEWGGTWTLASSKNAYIVEEGTEGIWTYRKWSDGTAECWGEQSISGYSITRTWGNLYVGPSDNFFGPNYPTNLFINAPSLYANVVSATSAMLLTAGTSGNTATTPTKYSLARGSSSGSGTYVVAFRAIGRWTNTSETYYRWHRTA